MEPLPPHDLRHTAASIAVHAGANIKALQRMLGHKSAAMTLDVYADLFDSDLDDVARTIDAAVQVASQDVGTGGCRTCSECLNRWNLKDSGKWAMRDSNPRHPPCKGGALTN